ncbi:BMC domain-containing protein [Saliterribacillus persicus]|uniref:BMC domain-containing protein n=1 Tax=Saliterribacillus persicus TaxID=930114 RepID=A0A368XVD5_9BACI|nr:BMC domain-containing protein [Saliterribacillus persicus]RCW71933.1 BMC domain-containing protein [Saliterribacillus persicus]
MNKFDAIGIVETQYFANALELLDQMSKAANVTFLSSQNQLGGRLVSIVIGGNVSDVKTAIEVAKEKGALLDNQPLKMALTITNPTDQILKFVQKDEEVSGKKNSNKQKKRDLKEEKE